VTLSITHRRDGNGSVVLVLSGDIDYGTVTILRAAISTAISTSPPPRRLIVDLRGVEVVDFVGIGTLVVGNRICDQVGVELAVRCPPSALRSLVGPAAAGRPPARRLHGRGRAGRTRSG
jgi:anti-anti-sigma factor